MLEIKGLCKTFGAGTVNEHKALDHVSLTMGEDEFITILGSNGAGKSTLFNAIAGTFFPDRGRILLNGQNITFMQDHKRAHMIGVVFQDPMKGTAPDLTVEENLCLAFTRSFRFALSRAVQRKDVAFLRDQLAEFGMGLEDRMKMKVGLLSGGQRQAMTLLMATISKPKLLLLDEHTAALDPATAEKVLGFTERIVREQHLPTMMITHNMQSALRLGTRTIMMDAGRIVLDVSGEERSTMQKDDLVRLFLDRSGKQLDNDRMLLAN